jgi:DNA-binding transcriptional ArsR family regulator
MLSETGGDDLLAMLAAMANPVRLRILAALAADRAYVSQLARDLRISRPLLHMHLQRLEAAGLVQGTLELSADGKALKFYEVTAFDLRLTPAVLAGAVRTLTITEPARGSTDKEHG